MTQWGATSADWTHFELILGLGPDLLPVVSNPHATIAAESTMKGLGKTPSWYNRNSEVVGIGRWTEKLATPANIEAWSKQADYGICLQTRHVRALDIDVDDNALSTAIVEAFNLAVGEAVDLPQRFRENSEKVLLAFVVENGPDDPPLTKRILRTAAGNVEFLADGQQFVAIGTHPSGVRYQWWGAELPDDFPVVPRATFEAAWAALVEAFAIEPPSEAGVRRRGESSGVADARRDWLVDAGLALDEGRDRQIFVECPWKSGHSMDSGATETAYFPAGTGGYEQGHYRCLHASCAHRTDADFDEALGYAAAGFDVLPEEVAGAAKEIGPNGSNSAALRVAGSEKEINRPIVLDAGNLLLVANSAVRHVWTRSDGAVTLQRAGGLWYGYTGTHYAELPEEAVRSDVWRFLDGVYKIDKKGNLERLNPGRDYISNVLDALRAVVEQRGVTPPCWLPGWSGPDPLDLVSLGDGALNVRTRELVPHSPGLFVLNALPYRWGDAQGEPVEWLRFLESLWGTGAGEDGTERDVEAIETLQEIMGYLLTSDTSQQKMFMVVGPRRSGKGTIGRIIGALVGRHNMAAPSMESLTGEFGLEHVVDKLVALIPDARIDGKSKGQAIVERLLMLSGEDDMSVNRKNKPFWTGRPSARVVILSNEVPRLGDASGALPGRFIVLSLYNSFYGREDHGLTKRLLDELPAIFRWALDGRDRLLARGYFRQPESGLDDAETMDAIGNPVAAFAEEWCERGVDVSDSTEALYSAWCAWCQRTGHLSGSRETFGRNLKTAVPGVRKARPRTPSGLRANGYAGIRVLDRVRKELLIGGEG